MMRLDRKLCAGLVAVAVAGAAFAHIRIANPDNGNPLFWQNPGNVSIVINSAGSSSFTDKSFLTAIRNGIDEWNAVTGTSAQLVENTNATQQARTDWASDDIHLVIFDESNTSGFFPTGSGIVAITPIVFFSSGRIVDADVLFNESQFNFTTSGQASRFDVQDVLTHELGHFLGLDHTGVAGGTMYPYVDTSVILHRSLSEDERGGMRDAYPSGSHGTITGTVQRVSNSAGVPGAYVVATDSTTGRTTGAALTDVNGDFDLGGLPAGTYRVFARPLDEPVGPVNITPAHVFESNFEPAVYGTNATVTAGQTTAMGVLNVGNDVALNLGETQDAFPMRVVAGQTGVVTIHGTGLLAGSQLTASDPSLTVIVQNWDNFGDFVSFSVTVPAGAAPGHVDLTVMNLAGDVTILPGALEITPIAPTVSAVNPSVGSINGGTVVTLTGTGYRAGSRVVIGDQVYVTGAVGGATLVDPNTLTLTTRPTFTGTHDVVVIDSSGVEGRKTNAYQTAQVPVVTTTFPTAGDMNGGTTLVLRGQDFSPSVVVRIDGVPQTVAWNSATRLTVTTTGGTAGGPYTLEVENPGGAIATSLFSYVAQADPVVLGVTPGTGFPAGGQTVTINGIGFTSNMVVEFGVDPDTGQGGTPAANVTFVGPTTIQALTPNHSSGTVALMVSDPTTAQATILPAAFNFKSSSSSGGGCSTELASPPPSDPRQVLAGALWLLVLGSYLVIRAQRTRAAHGVVGEPVERR